MLSGPLSDPDLRTRWESARERIGANRPATQPIARNTFSLAPALQVFASLDYLDVIASARLGSFKLCFGDGDRWIAALPDTRLGPYRIVDQPPLTAYTPAIVSTGEAVAEMLDDLSRSCDSFRIHFAPGAPTVDPELAASRNWTTETLNTYYAPIAGRTEMESAWSSNRSRTIRNFARDFTISESPVAGHELGRLFEASYARHGRRPRVGADAVATIADRATASGIARLFVARDSTGSVAASTAILVHGPAAYYWIAGSKPGPSMTVLLAAVFERLHAAGVSSFDFVGANTPGIAEFKRRFGSVRQSYQAVSAIRSRGLRFVLAAKSQLGRVLRG